MQVWNVLHAALWKYRAQKIAKNSPSGHHRTTLSRGISSQLRHISTIEKKLLNNNISPTCPHNMVNFRPTSGWDLLASFKSANFNGFRALAALLHGTVVVGVSQTLRRWTEGTTCIRRGGHHVGHWPTFLVISMLMALLPVILCWPVLRSLPPSVPEDNLWVLVAPVLRVT